VETDHSVLPLDNLLVVLGEHEVREEDMWGNIECACGRMFWEDIHAPCAQSEHHVHAAEELQGAFQEGRLFSPEFHAAWKGILEEYRA